LSRKAALKFIVDSEVTQTAFGTPRAANSLKKAVQTACTQQANPEQQTSAQPDLELQPSLSGLLSLSAGGANS
jgi:hypothetical protein